MRSVDDRGSLAHQAHARLKDEIIGLRRPPGQRLVERELADELGVSRIPLREALRLLEAEGLVVIVPRQGAMVAPFTADDVRHLHDVRESLEVLAAGLAAEQADAAGLAAAEEALVAAREAVAAEDGRAIAEANAAFHEAVVAMSGNPLLQSMMQTVGARVRWLFQLARVDDMDVRLCDEHEEIHRAIAGGDAVLAADLAARHLRATREISLAMSARWATSDLDPVEVTRTRQRATRTGADRTTPAGGSR